MADQPAPVGNVIDPYRAYNFKLQIQGIDEGHFTEVSGLAAKVQVIAYREGGGGPTVRRIPGRVEWGDVTLRYGLTSSPLLWQWFQTTLNGKVERKSVSIVMLEADASTAAMQWDLEGAWISEWRAAPLDALGREVAVETLTLVFESLERR